MNGRSVATRPGLETLAASPVTATLVAGLPAIAAEPPVPTLTVTATGEPSAVPDPASVTAGILSDTRIPAETRILAEAMAGAEEAAAPARAEPLAITVDRPAPRLLAEAAPRAGAAPIAAGSRTMSADLTLNFEPVPRAAA